MPGEQRVQSILDPRFSFAGADGIIRYVRGGFEKGDVDGDVKQMK